MFHLSLFHFSLKSISSQKRERRSVLTEVTFERNFHGKLKQTSVVTWCAFKDNYIFLPEYIVQKIVKRCCHPVRRLDWGSHRLISLQTPQEIFGPLFLGDALTFMSRAIH